MSLAEDRITKYLHERHYGYRPVACFNKECLAETGGQCWRQLECFSRWIGSTYTLTPKNTEYSDCRATCGVPKS